jgi:hypothetical protein
MFSWVASEGESMPKAKPISLHPLTFEQALKRLMEVDPVRLRIQTKPKKYKHRSKKK